MLLFLHRCDEQKSLYIAVVVLFLLDVIFNFSLWSLLIYYSEYCSPQNKMCANFVPFPKLKYSIYWVLDYSIKCCLLQALGIWLNHQERMSAEMLISTWLLRLELKLGPCPRQAVSTEHRLKCGVVNVHVCVFFRSPSSLCLDFCLMTVSTVPCTPLPF